MCSIKHSYICWREQSYGTQPVCILTTLQHQNISAQSMCSHSQGHGNQEITYLILLGLAAAFDTTDHEILLRRLEKRFSIKGTVNKWIESYLTNQYQCVIIGDVNTNGATSDPIRITQGTPMGSVLGPTLFILYKSPFGDLCRSHGQNYQLFADDQKIYMLFKPGSTGTQSQCISCLEACLEDTRPWMNTNLLKLNDDEMDFIILDTRQQLVQWNIYQSGKCSSQTSAKC